MKDSAICRLALLVLILCLVLPVGCGNGKNGQEDADADVTVEDVVAADEVDADLPDDPQPDDAVVEEEPSVDVPAEEGGGREKIEELCEIATSIMCDYFQQCCTPDERANPIIAMMISMGGLDCEDPTSTDAYIGCVEEISAAVDRGTAILNETNVDECMNALNEHAASCPNFGLYGSTQFDAAGEQCEHILTGQVEEDGACVATAECEDGLYCRFGTEEEGTCVPLVPEGEACMENEECGFGMTCVPGVPDRICSDKGGSGDPCDDYTDCGSGFYCGTSTGQCTERLAEGEECVFLDMGCEGLCITDGLSDPDGLCEDFCDGI